MPGTPDQTIAEHLLTMAAGIERDGLWTGAPNFADAASQALDVPSAAYRAATGTLPFLFTLTTRDATLAARSYIEQTSAAMDTLLALASHLEARWPELDWTDDPIERLANWPHLLGFTPEEIPQTMRDLAHSLTTAATAPAAA
jgi:hypothetical protein